MKYGGFKGRAHIPELSLDRLELVRHERRLAIQFLGNGVELVVAVAVVRPSAELAARERCNGRMDMQRGQQSNPDLQALYVLVSSRP